MSDKDAIRQLWKESFGDSDWFIAGFLEKFHTAERMLAIEENGKLVSMLHILPFRIGSYSIGYIYGIATAMETRQKGYATMLIRQAIELARDRKFNALALIPADQRLKEFYSRFGFTGEYPVSFSTPDNFDLGTGEKEKDILSILPLHNYTLPESESSLRLEWNEKTP